MEMKTFVFFDTETTGFRGCDPPKITEMAFVACLREHLLNPEQFDIPRVVFKLLLPLNPMKMIHPESTRITHLDNWKLENCKKMDANTIDLLKCFFNQLVKPICLVAHNGNGFDYPILKEHLKKLSCSFDEDIFCVDSWEIFKQNDQNLVVTNSAIDEFFNTDLKEIQKINEKTPSKPKSTAVFKKFANEKPSAARCLFPSSDSTPSTSNVAPTTSTATSTTNKNSSKISYKLTEIYKRLYKCEPTDSHNAESDAIHLLKCAVATGKEFVQLADSMAISFTKAEFK